MKSLYGEELYQVLALEQYKIGKAPTAYIELAKLVKFLEGKTSIKVILKNGTVHKLIKPHKRTIQAGDILTVMKRKDKTEFVLQDNVYLKPRLGENLSLEALNCLQFGKQKHYFNVEGLKQYQHKNEVND